MDVLALTGSQILANRWLFTQQATAAELYKKLVMRWHPDRNPDLLANKVIAHINAQYEFVKKGIMPNALVIGDKVYPYEATRSYELGTLYICPFHLIWTTTRANDDLAKRWLEVIKSFKFPNDDVKARISPYLPKNSHVKAVGDVAYTIIDRPAGRFIRIADIIEEKGPFDPRHVAWAMSRAYNLAGFLEYAGITHLDISAETMFIDPATHHGALLGGWFYTGRGDGAMKPLAAPSRQTAFIKLPKHTRNDAQIRAMGRQMIGARTAYDLRRNKEVREPMRSWLTGTPTSVGGATDGWKETLIASYGERKFTKLELSPAEIYKP